MVDPTGPQRTATPYIMGHSSHELARLQLQAQLLAPITRRLLREAGLQPGMRALALGCGTGEEVDLAAEIVGPSGSVLGIDRSDVAIATARARQGLPASVRFDVATVEQLATGEPFDFVFGRYIVMHQSSPAAFVRAAASVVRPGGLLAFHEIVLRDGFPTMPPSPLWDRANRCFVDAFRERLPQHDVARQLVGCFIEAGLASPHLFSECLVGAAATSPVTQWFAETLRTLAPDPAELFGESAADLSIATLADRLRDEGQRHGSQVFSCRQVCAWTRI